MAGPFNLDRGRRQTSRPALSLVSLPARSAPARHELLTRVLLGVAILAVNTALVFADRDGYSDRIAGHAMSLLDAFYYTMTTITSTGYGDITPVEAHTRLIHALVIVPLRLVFIVLVVGTVLEVLTHAGRQAMQDARWRKNMRAHTVVLGYGTIGRSAVATLRRAGVPVEKILIVDSSPKAVAEANRNGYAAFEGDATFRELLTRAEVPKAREIIVTLNRDDTAILATLTVRQLNPGAHLVAAVRQEENVSLLKQSGADAVVTSSEAVGRLMGLSSVSPQVGQVMEDLLAFGEGMEVTQRLVTSDEAGKAPVDIAGEQVLAVIRNKTLRRFYDPSVATLQLGDGLVVVRASTPAADQPR